MSLFTIGGGYAMLPLLEKEVAEKKQWATREDLLDYFAIGQVTPGIIAMNVATFIGIKQKGFLGAICATLGMATPSLVLITFIAAVLTNFMDNVFVVHIFNGVRLGIAVLIFNSLLSMGKKALIDKLTYIIFAIVFLLSVFTNISAVYYVIGALIVGFIYKGGVVKK